MTVENIPDDMGWEELEDLGRQYGDSVSYSRTYRRGDACIGVIEYSTAEDARRCVSELDGRRIEDGTRPMRAYSGAEDSMGCRRP